MAFKFLNNIFPQTHTDAIYQLKEFMKNTTDGPGWTISASGTGVYDSSPASYIHWKLDESSGNLFRNSGALGENNLSTDSYEVVSGVESLSGKGVRLNGVNDSYLSTGIQAVSPENKFTVSFLVRVHDVKASCLLLRGTNSATDVSFEILDVSGSWKVSYTVGGTPKNITVDGATDPKITANQDYLLSFTYATATTGTGYTATAYLNAVVSGSNVSFSKSNSETSAFSWLSNAKWVIGNNFAATSPSNATFSDIRIENLPRNYNYLNTVYLLHKNSHFNWKLNEQSGLTKLSSNGSSGEYTLFSNLEAPEYCNAGHTVTKLNNNKVLVVGGSTTDCYLADPVDGIFSKTGSLSTTRSWHAATLLKDGYVLITGGESDGAFGDGAHVSATATAELYDPTSGTFTAVSNMANARSRHTATLITSGSYDGYVLVAGGLSSSADDKVCELYNPTTKSFIGAGSMKAARSSHSATVVNGKILLAGGVYGSTTLSSTEIFDFSTGAFVSGSTPSLSSARANHTATLLSDNTVLFVGGETIVLGQLTNVSSVESCDSLLTAFTTVTNSSSNNLSLPRSYHSSVLLNDGKVLITGGVVQVSSNGSTLSNYTKDSFVYNPSVKTFTPVSMIAPRANHQSVLLQDKNVLVVGGAQNGSNSEVYDAVLEVFRPSNAFVSTASPGMIGNATSFSPIQNAKIYLPFNSDTNFSDISSNGVVVTNNNASLSSAASKSAGNSCYFNGTDGYLSFTPGFSLANVGWTIDAWVYPKNLSTSFQTIVSRSSNANLDWAIQISSSKIRFRTNNDNASVVSANASNSNLTANVAIASNTWHRIVAKHDGSSLSLYVNDLSKAVATETLAVTAAGGTTAKACVGCMNFDAPTEHFDGYIDNLRISVADRAAIVNLSPNKSFYSYGNPDLNTALLVRFRNRVYSAKANVTKENFAIFNQTDVYDTHTKINWKMEENYDERVIGYANILKNNFSDVNVEPWQKDDSDLVAKEFIPTVRNTLAYARHGFSATLLANGKILIAGGNDGTSAISNAELYDPLTKTFSSTGSLNTARQNHTATLLANGKVLVVGGKAASSLSSAEIFDPVTNTFTASSSTVSARHNHSACLLNDGYVLVVGGSNGTSSLNDGYLYDPSADSFASAGTFTGERSSFTATKLANGKVLICGGSNTAGTSVNTTVIYDRTAGSFSSGPNMVSARSSHTATLLPSGKVLLAGGVDASSSALATTELFDPSAAAGFGSFTAGTSLTSARHSHTAALLTDGYVVLAGGLSGSTYLATSQAYSSTDNTVGAEVTMASARANASCVSLVDSNLEGRAVIIGGQSSASTVVDTAEIFAISSGALSASTSASSYSMGASIALEDPEVNKLSAGTNVGKVLVTGGMNGGVVTKSTKIFDPNTASVSDGPDMADKRVGHFAVQMNGGDVLVGGGYDNVTSYQTSAEVYSQTTNQFTAAPSTSSPRYLSAAALMNSGQVMVAGGKTDSAVLNTVEIYNPGSVGGASSLTPIDSNTNIEWKFDEDSSSQFFADDGYGKQGTTLYGRDFPIFANDKSIDGRQLCTATKLSNGKVLIAGGWNGSSVVSTAEIFDPATGAVYSAGQMIQGRYAHQANLLNDGTILFTGGQSGSPASSITSSAEIYDPATNSFYSVGPMSTARSWHQAALLTEGPNAGKVLVICGLASSGSGTTACELYDPTTKSFSSASSANNARWSAASAVLKNGNIFVVGGATNGGATLLTSEVYDAQTGLFTNSGNTANGRDGAIAALLSDGRVLVAGGAASGIIGSTAEVYDPLTGTFTAAGNLNYARNWTSGQMPNASLLSSGKVLICGGNTSATTATCEIYDPATNQFSYTSSSMSEDRAFSAQVALEDGRVAVFGGLGSGSVYRKTIEIYNPSTNTFSLNAAKYKFGTAISRENPEAISINNKVFVTGGTAASGYLSSTEIYDPSAGTSSSGPAMSSAREGHILQPLPNNKALIAGGTSNGTTYLNTAQIYDSSSNSFTDSDFMTSARYKAKSTVLSDNKILITGGYASSGSDPLATAEVYSSKTSGGSANLPAIDGYTEINLKLEESTGSPQLANSKVGSSVASGLTNDFPVFANTSLSNNALRSVAVTLSNGNVLILGGTGQKSADILDALNGVVVKISDMTTIRASSSISPNYSPGYYTATLLLSGKVLIVGGHNGTATLSSCELYDPATNTFSSTGSMGVPRSHHRSVLMQDGRVLVCGGYTNPSYSTVTQTAEIYDPSTGTFSYAGNMTTPRRSHSAELIKTGSNAGKVIVIGGSNGSSALNSTELFDPSSGSGAFSSGPNLNTGRWEHASVTISGGTYDGYVLVAGGSYFNSGTFTLLNATELYNPNSNTFSALSATLTINMYAAKAVQISSDKILIVAGTYSDIAATRTVTNIYTISSQSISAGPSRTFDIFYPNANIISGGKYDGYVLVCGESTNIELYNPSSNSFTSSASTNLTSYKFGSFAGTYNIQQSETAKLSDGRVLVTGGTNGTVQSANAIYNPADGTFTTSGVPALTPGKINHFVSPTTSGNYLIAGGNNSTTYYNTAQIYTESAGAVGSIAATAGNMNESRTMAKASKIQLNSSDGYVLVTGGHAGSGASNTAEIYNPNTSTFSYSTKSNSATYSLETTTIDSNTLYNWKLNDASGASSFVNSAISSSGSAISLSKGGTTASITSGVTGIDGYCVSFTGSSWLFSADTSINPGPASLTMSCWVKLSSYSSTAPIFYKSYVSGWSSPYASFGFFQGSSANGSWFTRMTINGAVVERTITTNIITLGTWALLSATYDGKTINTYLNGILVDAYGIEGTISYSGSTPYVVGGQHSGGGTHTAGSIDDVRVDNTVRSANYIRSLYLSALGYSSTGPNSNTIINWKLDESSSSTSLQNSGAGGNGANYTLSKAGSPSVVSGLTGKGISFTGSSSDYLYSQINPYQPSGDFTISVWVYLRQVVGNYSNIITKALTTDGNWDSPGHGPICVFIPPNSRVIRFRILSLFEQDTSYEIPLNSWTLISLTRSGNDFNLYANGNVVKSTTQPSFYWGSGGNWYLGGHKNFGISINGIIDEVRIEDTARSQQYLTNQYQDTINGSILSSAGGSMSSSRHSHTSTTLSDGKVLIVGGATHSTVSSSAPTASNGFALPTAEIYDPSTGLFQLTSSDLSMPRYNHTATLLPSGKVLITGGQSLTTAGDVKTAELYDPFTKTFTTVSRAFASSSDMVQPDNSTYINWKFNETLGATSWANTASSGVSASLTQVGSGVGFVQGVEGYAPLFTGTSGTYLTTSSSISPNNSNVTLSCWINVKSFLSGYSGLVCKDYYSNGNALSPWQGGIAFFVSNDSQKLATTVTVNPATRALYTDAAVSLNTWYHVAVTYDKLNIRFYLNGALILSQSETRDLDWGNGNWIIGNELAGGAQPSNAIIDDIRIENTVRSANYIMNMYLKGMQALPPAGRSYATAKLLPNNKNVVIVGGQNGSSALASAEIFDVYSQKFSSISIPNATYNHRSELSSTGDLVVIGGYNGSAYTPVQLLNSSEIRQYSDGVDAKASLVKRLSSITTTDTAVPSTTNGFTMSVWVKLNSYTQNGLILGKKFSPTSSETDPTGSGYSVLLKLTSGGSWQYLGSQGAKSVSGSSVPLALNSWNLLSVTNDGYNTNVYKNGSLVATVPENLTTSNALGTGAWSLGSNASSAFYGIDGYLDDLRIESKARSASEIAALYAGAGGFTPTINGMSVGRIGHSSTLLKNGKVLVAGGTSDQTFTTDSSTHINWKFNEALGSTSWANTASSGVSANLTQVGTGVSFVKGIEGYAPLFGSPGSTGASGSMLKTSGLATNNLPSTSNITISAWVYIRSYSNISHWFGLVLKEYQPNPTHSSPFNSFSFYVDSSNNFYTDLYVGAGITSATAPSSLNTWYLLTSTYDSAAGQFKFYVNGNLVQTNSVSGNVYWGQGEWIVGNTVDGNAPADAIIDDIRIENTVRSESYIKMLYSRATNKADLYDPATRTFTATGNLNLARYNHSASLINGGAYDGYVLIAGGQASSTSGDVSTCELYDPTAGTFSTTNTIKPIDSNTFINWKLDETGGTTWSNSGTSNTSGSIGNLTAVGSNYSIVNGISGKGVSITGSSYLKTTGMSASNLPSTTNVTMSAWVYPRDTAKNSYVLQKSYRNDTSWSDPWIGGIYFYLHSSGKFQTGITSGGTLSYNGVGVSSYTVNNVIISANNWHLLTATYDGFTLNLYVNGILTGQTPKFGSLTQLDWGSGEWFIGGSSGASAEWFNGIIDDVRIENTVRSQDYIKELYMSGVGFMRSDHSAITLPNNNILLSGGKSSSTVRSDAMIYESQVGEIRPVSMGYSTYRHRTALSSTGDAVVVGGTDGVATPTYRPVQLLNSSESRIHTTGTNGNAASSSTFSSLYTKDTWVAPKSNSCTISLWVNLRTHTPNAILIAKKATSSTVESDPTGSGYAFMLKLTNDGYWQYSSDQGLYGTTISSVSNKIALNTPTLISVTNNGTSTTIYKNGVSVATVTQPAINFGYGAWSVGSNASNSLYNIDGYIDDVRIENTARSASYLLGLYGAPSTATDPYTIINWKLNETQGTNLMADSGTNSGLRLSSKDDGLFANDKMQSTRYAATYTALANGKILIAGGTNGNSPDNGTPLNTADIYDPYTGTITPTGNMNVTRYRYTSALLLDGRVLIVGDSSGSAVVEIYDPMSGKFSITGSMSTARQYNCAAVTMANGKVLVAGGNSGGYLSSAEVYDPATGLFTATGSMVTARDTVTGSLLSNGKVLIVGGWNGGAINTCELYDPATGTFASASNRPIMTHARLSAAISTLQDGRLLISSSSAGGVNTSEIYDPSSGAFGSMSGPYTMTVANRGWLASSVTLPNGQVLVSGGSNSQTTAELFNPSNNSFSATTGPMGVSRYSHGSFLMPNGKVVVIGGSSTSTTAEIYDPSTKTFSANSSSFKFGDTIYRENPEITKLEDGRVFVTGGFNGSYLSTTTVYNPSTGTSISGPALPSSSARRDHFSAKLSNGNVLVGGGYNGTSYLNSTYVYTPASGADGYFGSAINMNTTRALAKAVTLNDGKVLVTGGHNGGNSLQTAEIYSGSSFGSNINMVVARHSHTATKLNDGYVLIAGGATSAAGSTSLSSAEIFDPSTNTFTSVGSLNKARYNHTATLLADGTVLIAGGQSSTTAGDVTDAEIYNPITKKFTYAGNLSQSINAGKLNTGRSFAQATLLPNKNVLISGGKNSSTTLATSEIYDFYKKTFTTVSMVNSTTNHRAVISDAGDVVLIGGTDGSTTYRPVQLFNSSQTAQKLTGPDNFAISTKGITSLSSIDTTIAPKSNEFTISFFVNITSYSSNGIFIAKKYSSSSPEYNATGSGYALSIKQRSSNNGSWQITANNGATTLNSSSNIALNRVTHVAITNGANGCKLYLDGSVVATGSRLTVDFGSGPWSVGSNASSNFFASNALIDEIRIESTERDAAYILGLCNSRAGFILMSSTMTASRWGHTITALPSITDPNMQDLIWPTTTSNNMLIVGGATDVAGSAVTGNIDLYDPSLVGNQFSNIGQLSVPRYNHAAIMVSGHKYAGYNGYVIVVGGKSPGAAQTYTTVVEACHPMSRVTVGNIQIGREKPSVILLPNGNLLITGGYNASGAVSTAEIFDIYSGTSSLLNMPYPTQKHRAVLTNSNNVVVVGGKKDDNITAASYLKTQLFNASSIRSRVSGIYNRVKTQYEYPQSWTGYYGEMQSNRWYSQYANRVNKLTSMSTPNNPILTPSSNKFTVSAWVYLNSYTSNALLVGKKNNSSANEHDPSGSGYSFAIKQTVGGAWQVIARNSSGAPSIVSASDKKIPLNTWTLLSVTNNGIFTRAYINGIPACLPTSQSSVDFGTGPWSVASNPSNNAYAMDGYIDDVRIEDITRTSAYLRNLYTKTTSPSAAVTNLFEDASLYAKDIVPRGSAGSVTSAATPSINRGTSAGTSVTEGYSGVFNGTDGYLEFVPNFTLRNKPWTMEAWFYPRSGALSTIVSCGSNWNLSASSSSVVFGYGSSTLTGNAAISTNAWHHVAATHDGSTLRLFVDGYMAASGSVMIPSGGETSQATIGCKNDGAMTQFFDGYMDDLRVLTDRCLYKSSFAVGGDGIIGNKVTLSCWVYPKDYGTSESGIVYKLLDNSVASWSAPASPPIAMGMSLSSNGTVNHYVTVDGITHKNSFSGIRLNRWSLLTMTFNGTTSTITSYLNDSQVASQVLYSVNDYGQVISPSGNIDWGNHGSWYVGSFSQQGRSFNGNVCDVRFENTARSSTEVTALYNHVSGDLFGISGTSDLITSKDELKKYSWFVLKSNSTSNPRYLCFQRGETLDKWRVKYSTAAFATTPGSFSYDTTPSPASSSDEATIRGGGTNSTPTFGSLFNGLTENQYVLHAGAGTSAGTPSDANKFFFFAYSKGDVASKNPAKTMFIMDYLPDFSGSRPILGVLPAQDSDTTVLGVLNNFAPSYNHVKYSNYSSDYSANNFDRLKGFVSKGISGRQSFVNVAVASWGPIITYNGADGYDGYAWSPSQSAVKNSHTNRFGLMPANYFYQNAASTSDLNRSYKGSSNMVYTAAANSDVNNWDKFTVDSVENKIIVNGFVLPWNDANTQDS